MDKTDTKKLGFKKQTEIPKSPYNVFIKQNKFDYWTLDRGKCGWCTWTEPNAYCCITET